MIIGIAGYAQSGKDTFGQFLLELLPGYKRMAFADPLKEMLKDVAFNTQAKKEDIRPLYVELGKLGRKKNPNFWLNILQQRKSGNDIVITDVRYANEAKWILEQGGCLFYMKRPGFEPTNEEERQSIRELLSLHRPYMVYNNGSLEQFRAVAVTVVENLEKHREGRKVEEYRPYNAHELVDLVSQNPLICCKEHNYFLSEILFRDYGSQTVVVLHPDNDILDDLYLTSKGLLELCKYPNGRKCGVRLNA